VLSCALSLFLVIVCTLMLMFFFGKSSRRIGGDLPFFRINTMSWKERYAAQVFYCFDTLLPRYQWRHKIKEVESWMVEEGLDPVSHAHSFYTASSVPVRAAADKAIGKSFAGAAT